MDIKKRNLIIDIVCILLIIIAGYIFLTYETKYCVSYEPNGVTVEKCFTNKTEFNIYYDEYVKPTLRNRYENTVSLSWLFSNESSLNDSLES